MSYCVDSVSSLNECPEMPITFSTGSKFSDNYQSKINNGGIIKKGEKKSKIAPHRVIVM